MINAISSQQDFRRKAEFAKSIIGYDLLNYTLNTSQFNNSQGQALTLSPQQEQALSSLCLNLQCALKRSIESFTSTDYPIVELQRLQYNTYRKQSGGKTPDFITDDPLLNFIIEQVIKVFPRLLMIDSTSAFLDIHIHIHIHEASFSKFIQADKINALTTNH